MRHAPLAFVLLSTPFFGCKLLHRDNGATDAAVIEPTPVAATTDTAPSPSLSAVPPVEASASASAGALASASPSATVDERVLQQALHEAAEFGMLALLDGGGNVGELGTTRRRSGPPATLRLGSVTVNGRLPPEIIQRILRAHFAQFRHCYDEGLRSNPSLEGRVTAKLVIGTDGSVKTTQDSGSDMPDQGVTNCVVHAMTNLSFPQPEGGVVIVTAPIMFSPS